MLLDVIFLTRQMKHSNQLACRYRRDGEKEKSMNLENVFTKLPRQ